MFLNSQCKCQSALFQFINRVGIIQMLLKKTSQNNNGKYHFLYIVQGIKLFYAFCQQRESFLFPTLFENGALLNIVEHPSFVFFPFNWAYLENHRIYSCIVRSPVLYNHLFLSLKSV